MFGVLVNTATVLLGSIIGLLCKKGIPERLSSAVMVAIGLCTVANRRHGVGGGRKHPGADYLHCAGVLVGELLDIDGRVNRLVEKVAGKTAGCRKGGADLPGIYHGLPAVLYRRHDHCGIPQRRTARRQ